MISFLLYRVEKIVGIGENAEYQHFSPFPTMFLKKTSSSGHIKVWNVW